MFNNSKHHVPGVGPHVMMGELCLVNSYSYQTASQVGKHIQRTAIGDRTWTDIIMRKLQQRTFHCPQCNDDLTSTCPEFVGHMSYVHNANINANELVEYVTLKNILLLTGAGHFEMNMLRCIMKFTWETIFILVANLMGFRSPRAEKFAEKRLVVQQLPITNLSQRNQYVYDKNHKSESNAVPVGVPQ